MNEADMDEFEHASNEAAYIAGEIEKEYASTDGDGIQGLERMEDLSA